MEHLATHWYFHLPNYVLAILLWTMVGRFILGLFVHPDWPHPIWQAFRRVTDPVLRLTGRLSPSFMVEPLLPLVAIFYLFLLRILLQFVMLPEARAFYLLLLHLLGIIPVSWLPTG